jgi:hypothetical protein
MPEKGRDDEIERSLYFSPRISLSYRLKPINSDTLRVPHPSLGPFLGIRRSGGLSFPACTTLTRPQNPNNFRGFQLNGQINTEDFIFLTIYCDFNQAHGLD